MANGSSGRLAKTTFNSNPNNELAVVDVYENGSSGIENSFQDTYNQIDGNIAEFANLGKSALGSSGSLINSLNSKMSLANSILNGIKNGNISSVLSITGGASNGLKQVSDLLRGVTNNMQGATRLMNNVANLANNIKGGRNAKDFALRLVGNLPIARQAQNIIRQVGNIDRTASSLERSVNRASSALGGLLGNDNASSNTIVYGTFSKPLQLENPGKLDLQVTPAQTNNLIERMRDIDSNIASAIGELPMATQQALVRGMDDSIINRGVLVQSNNSVIQTNGSAALNVVKPLNKIISSMAGKTESSVVVQDPGAISTLIAGVTNVANATGMKNTFSTITSKVTNKEIIVAAAKPLLQRASQDGDLDTIIDISKSQAGKEIKHYSPEIIKTTTNNVLRPEGMSEQEYSGYYTDVKKAFIIIDKNWSLFKTSTGFSYVDGTVLNNNSFMCDIIEASINRRRNEFNKSNNQQVINSPVKTIEAITVPKVEEPKDTFAEDLEKEIDKLNEDFFEELVKKGDTLITLPEKPKPETPTEPEVPVDPKPEVPVEPVLDYSNEPFLLLGSVFVDFSVESEIQKHFPYLYSRFQVMGTF